MMAVSATEDVQEDITAEPEVVDDEEGHPDLSHTNDVVEIESDFTLPIHIHIFIHQHR
jgi:hypothetical protein